MARHCGMRVFGMSLVTNECVVNYDEDRIANHEEVLETGRERGLMLQKFIAKFVEKL